MRTLLRRALLGILAACVAVPLVDPLGRPAQAAPPGCAAATPGDLTGYFDAAIPDLLRKYRVPGAVVSVVSGGATAFAKAYGLADLARGVPLDASRSLVRVGSISKLFTWTAVMQQVEAGRLDLHADVNRYLKGFRIPDTYPQPVTLLDLMDHTAGFEDFSIATAGRTAADVPPLREYLANHMPARIRPPGEISAYSNYGAALAGYIVATVSGEPYDQYVRRHVLDPLGMSHSTATEPVPAALSGDLARSYDSASTPPRPIPFMFDETPPDGSLSATATDMAAFMNAHLHGGGPVLAPATEALMQERSFAADPRLDGYAHGFVDRTINGHRVLMHDGGWEGFRSVLMLVPGCDLGVFLAFNGTGASDAGKEFTDGLFNRFVPAVPGATAPVSEAGGALSPAGPLAGFYQPTRHNESTVEKIANLLGSARLTVAADGTVHFGGSDWVPQGGGLYRTADGTRLVFLAAPDGHRYLATDGPAYELVPRSGTPPFNLLVLLAAALPALSALALPVWWAIRRLRRRPTGTTGKWRAARRLAAGASVLGIAFLVALFGTLTGNTDEFLYRVPRTFQLLLAVPVAVLAASAAAAALTLAGWRGSGAGVTARAHQLALLAGLAALAWFLVQWNLVGWRYA
jgi:CubicO group peptidase (beta-lactamase class C family)